MALGNRIAPPRFIAFAIAAAVAGTIAVPLTDWRIGTMIGFDAAALLFLAICVPLLGDSADEMREAAARNDTNRAGLLAITGAVTLVVLVAVGSILTERSGPKPVVVGLIVATLVLAWIFSNFVYALHYAHMAYVEQPGSADDCGGLDFPKTDEPNYWDFVYFAFCLGMTFQTSDVTTTSTAVRKVVTFHCLAAFIFNLGVIAFTINVLGSS